MQDGLSLHIGEVHILHADVTVLTDQLIAALRQGLFPCPDAGTVVGFDQGAVYLLGVHQGDHAVILLARFIHQFKDAFGTGQRHDDRVDLLGDLADGHGEAAGKLQKGSDTAQRYHADADDGEIGDRGDGQKPADNGDQYILQVAEVAHDGHHDIGVGVGLGGVEAEFIIEGVKVLLVLLLVAEYLDDLLPADHFLDKAIDPAEGLLLLDEIFGAAAADLFHDDHHQPQKDEHQQREPDAGAQHGDKYRSDADQGADGIGQTLADHLPQGIGIIGVVAHHVAVGVGIKIFNGERLHMSKHIVPDGFKSTLRHGDHQAGLQVGGQHAGQIDAGHDGKRTEQRGEIGGGLPDERSDVVIDQRFKEQGGCHAGNGADKQQDEYDRQPQLVAAGDIAEESLHGSFGVFGLFAAGKASSGSAHSSSPPFCCDSNTSR